MVVTCIPAPYRATRDQTAPLNANAKTHIGGTFRHLSTLDAHGHANIRLVQRWGIIHLTLQ
jgi:hypothetical protein